MQVSANQSPALELNGTGTANYNSFYDYIPTVIGTPDYNYSAPSPGSSTFGFALAADADASAVQLFRNSSNLCNQSNGVTSGDNCWYGFSTSPLTVVNDSTFTGGNTTETLAFRAQRTSSTTSALESGNYTATIIVTAYSN